MRRFGNRRAVRTTEVIEKIALLCVPLARSRCPYEVPRAAGIDR
jgi:hypothetical protein